MLNNVLTSSLLALCSLRSSCELGLRNNLYFVIFQGPLLAVQLFFADPCASEGRETVKASFVLNVNMELNYRCVQVMTIKKLCRQIWEAQKQHNKCPSQLLKMKGIFHSKTKKN